MEDEVPLFSQWMVASRKSRRMAPLCYSNVEVHRSVGSLVQSGLGLEVVCQLLENNVKGGLSCGYG